MSGPKTMLVVEDNEITRAGLAAVPRREGFAVALAADGREALALQRVGPPPGLILTDMLMPALDGWGPAGGAAARPAAGGGPCCRPQQPERRRQGLGGLARREWRPARPGGAGGPARRGAALPGLTAPPASGPGACCAPLNTAPTVEGRLTSAHQRRPLPCL